MILPPLLRIFAQLIRMSYAADAFFPAMTRDAASLCSAATSPRKARHVLPRHAYGATR